VFTAPRRDLREYLAQVPDPRGLQGRRHVWTATLTAVVCAILQGCRGFDAIGQWLQEVPLDFTRDRANAARLLPLNRGHWGIENGVFYVRDEAFGEDRSRVRRGSAPEVLAGLRNAALSLLRLAGSTNISASLRNCTWNLRHVLNLLGIVN